MPPARSTPPRRTRRSRTSIPVLVQVRRRADLGVAGAVQGKSPATGSGWRSTTCSRPTSPSTSCWRRRARSATSAAAAENVDTGQRRRRRRPSSAATAEPRSRCPASNPACTGSRAGRPTASGSSRCTTSWSSVTRRAAEQGGLHGGSEHRRPRCDARTPRTSSQPVEPPADHDCPEDAPEGVIPKGDTAADRGWGKGWPTDNSSHMTVVRTAGIAVSVRARDAPLWSSGC